MGPLGAALLVLSGAASLAYWVGLSQSRAPLRPWFKGLAVAPLAAYGAVAGGPWLLVAALALSAVGDVLLALDEGERLFVPGLLAFLLAHLAYLALFVPDLGMPDAAWRVVALGALLGLGGAVFMRIRPALGPLALPVAGYLAVLTAMVAAALAAGHGGLLVALGALLFAASDALLAVERFERPFPGSAQAVWASYWLAQLMLLEGILTAA